MNRIVTLIVSFLISFSSVGKLQLYTNEGLNEKPFEELMEDLLQDEKDILFYVHGRGKHPSKGLKILPEIERRYDMRVVLFHWDSWSSMFDRPVENAIEGGRDLATLFDLFNVFKESRSEEFSQITVSLLVYSMGNITLQSYMENHFDGGLQKDLFGSLILNAADCLVDGHKEWLEEVNFASSIFVVSNENDKILAASKVLTIFEDKVQERLGRRVTYYDYLDLFETNKIFFPLAENASYMNFSDLLDNGHRHFLRPNPFFKTIHITRKRGGNQIHKTEVVKINPSIHFFFANIFHGKSFNIDDYKGLEVDKNQSNYYFFNL